MPTRRAGAADEPVLIGGWTAIGGSAGAIQ